MLHRACMKGMSNEHSWEAWSNLAAKTWRITLKKMKAADQIWRIVKYLWTFVHVPDRTIKFSNYRSTAYIWWQSLESTGPDPGICWYWNRNIYQLEFKLLHNSSQILNDTLLLIKEKPLDRLYVSLAILGVYIAHMLYIVYDSY